MKPKLLSAFALFALLLSANIARADLANCFVYTWCYGQLDKANQKALTDEICDAYAGSDQSADDMVFLLVIYGDYPPGGYSIGEAKLKLYGSWTLVGYEIEAANVAGLKNGVAEIKKAFADGRIYDLKGGKREGPVKEPLYEEEE